MVVISKALLDEVLLNRLTTMVNVLSVGLIKLKRSKIWVVDVVVVIVQVVLLIAILSVTTHLHKMVAQMMQLHAITILVAKKITKSFSCQTLI